MALTCDEADAWAVAPPPRLRTWAATGLTVLAVAAIYYSGAKIGLSEALVRDQVTPLWPPTGIAVAALLLGGLRLWPGIALGAFLVNATLGPSIATVLLITTGNALAPVCAYYLLRKVGFRPELDRMRDAVVLVFLGAFAGMLVSATVGTAALVSSGALAREDFWSTWSVWWAGDAMGVLIVVPLVLAIRTRTSWRTTPRRWLEAVGLLMATTGVALLVTSSSTHLLFLVFPFLIWAALRFQHIGAAPCALVVVVAAVHAAAMASGPFAGLDLVAGMVTLQAFNGSVVLTTLLLSAIVSQRNAALQAIERTCAQLAEVVGRYQPLLLRGIISPERVGRTEPGAG